MEKRIDSIVFRRLTYADFQYINNEGSHYSGGGGQSYIDFPTTDVSLADWSSFLGTGIINPGTSRLEWRVDINSFGLSSAINLKIYNRRAQSVSIAAQKINSRSSNRIPSWRPTNSFPINYDPSVDNLVIYIVKTDEGDFWAGWFLKNAIPKNWPVDASLRKLFTEESAGYLKFDKKVLADTENKEWPFYFDPKTIRNQIKEEKDKEEDLIAEDTAYELADLGNSSVAPELLEKLIKYRQRNSKVVKNLKQLYGGRCQITGDTLTFEKTNGELYSEVHHLIPLGKAGSDSYSNAIVVSPLIHRMLHYANVSEIDLSKIIDHKLPIIMAGKSYEITWHPDHTQLIKESIDN